MAKGKERKKVGLGLLGSGVVGEAIQDIVFTDFEGKIADDLELEIRKIYTPHPRGKKWFSQRSALFTANAREVIDDSAVDIVIEVLGFQEPQQLAVFKDYFVQAFEKGKPVVTSDKAVLAAFGPEIWRAAERTGQELRFEACVGGGVPIIRALRESFAVEAPEAIFGIVNGTCNYVLSEMKRSAQPYAEALREAQSRGYAETDPKADVSGADAEAKLILLAAVTFGVRLEPGGVWRRGIEEIHAIDFLYAERKGSSTIKHIAAARNNGGALQAFVSPILVPQGHFLSGIDGAANAFFFKGKKSGSGGDREALGQRDWDYAFVGPGAGGGPTAVAVLGDVCELARGRGGRPAGLSRLAGAERLSIQPENEIDGRFYLRFVVKDRAGIVGDIGQTFGRTGINISEIWQLSHSTEELEGLIQSYSLNEKPREILPFVITLEHATLGQIREALKIIRNQDYMLADPVWFPIWGSK